MLYSKPSYNGQFVNYPDLINYRSLSNSFNSAGDFNSAGQSFPAISYGGLPDGGSGTNYANAYNGLTDQYQSGGSASAGGQGVGSNNASDQALDDFIAIANGGGTAVLDKRLTGFVNGTFDDSNTSPAGGYLGESYGGIPIGGFLTDVSISKDISLKVQLLESRIQYVISYLLGLLEQGPEAIAGLLQRRGMSQQASKTEATRLLNEIVRKAPDFVAAAQRAVRQARQRIEGMQQLSQASDSRTQTLNQSLSKVISSFGGGGGGGGG